MALAKNPIRSVPVQAKEVVFYGLTPPKNRHKSLPRLLENLIIVCIVEDEESRLLLFAPLKYRQVNFHRHGVGLNVLDNAMKLSVVNVNVRNFHAVVWA